MYRTINICNDKALVFGRAPATRKPASTRQLRLNQAHFSFLLCLFLILFCSGIHAATTLKVQVIDAEQRGVAGIVVYAVNVNKKVALDAGNIPLQIKQQDKAFSPYIAVTTSGSQVIFDNRDNITHHIYSITGDNRFSFKLKAGELKSDLRFDKAGVIAMGCNIHDWMSGYLLVLDTPYFAQTKEQGYTELSLDPDSTYRVVAWHPRLKEELAQIISFPAKAAVTITLPAGFATSTVQKGVNDFDFLEGY